MTLTPHPYLPHFELRDGDRVVARVLKTMCPDRPRVVTVRGCCMTFGQNAASAVAHYKASVKR